MPANSNARRAQPDYSAQFEPFTRIAKLYEKAGVTADERMIPYHMSDSFNRFISLLTNDREGVMNYISRPYIADVVKEQLKSNPVIQKVLTESDVFRKMSQEELTAYTNELIKTVVDQKWDEPRKFLIDRIGHKYKVAGFYERRMLSGGGIADALLTLGVQKEEKKQYYSSWYGKGQIIRISHEEAPSLYITGEPGAGKTNGSHDLIEEMIANQYWIYTNMPVVSDYGHVMITRHYSDLYIDTPQIPSILRALLWARKHRIPSGSYLVYDEGGRGAAAKSTTLEGEALRGHLQIRRHFTSGFVHIGAQRMQAKQEGESLLDYLIEAKRIDTGKMDAKRQPIYRYYWDIATRGPNKTTLHEYVYNIPFTRLTLNYANELRLPYPLDMDMLSLESFEKAVDFVATPLEQLITDTRNYVRQTYRPELLGAPVYGEDDDEETVVKEKEKEVLRAKLEEPVKKSELDLPQDQVEAIGELRKLGTGILQISREFNIPLAVVTKVCRQYGWL